MNRELPLTRRDLENFNKSFIDEAAISRAGVFRVDSDEGARLIGRKTNGTSDYSGVIFPYFFPEELGVREYRLRRDNPDLEFKNGELKEKAKYLSPPGKSNMIYFPRNCSKKLLEDISLPLVITEGEKKSLALERVAWHGLGDSAENPRFLTLGLSGVWNFRGKVAKTVNANGHRQDVKGLIADFLLLSLKGRRVIILFDANVKRNESVRVARDVLAKELKKLGAEVLIVDCPEISGCNGIDDALGNWERTEGEQKAIQQCLELLESAESASEKKSSQVDQLLAIACDMDLFHTPEMEPFVAIEVKHHIEYHRINSLAFRQRLSYQFYKGEGKAPSSNAIQDTINALSGKALFEGPVHNIHLRVACFGGNIYLDLCNDTWQVIEISQHGWKVLESSSAPIRFNRNSAMRPLPLPLQGGDSVKLHQFLNVDTRNLVLIISWLINTYRPDFPFPILILSGEQGTAKSTTSKILRELVDPSKIPFRSSPRNEQDLMIAATRSWVIGLDNLSHIPDWFSDALCRLSTGGGFGARKLYSDDDEAILEAKRPIVINGIGDLASRSDLLDRALIVRLDPIPPDKRKSENEFWAEFEREKSAIFTGLLDAISCGLRRLNDGIILKSPPRMADFAQWVCACEPGLSFGENAFLNIYNDNRKDAHSIVLEDSLLAEVIQEFCDQKAINDECDVSDVLLKEFLSELKNVAGEKRSGDKRFPKSSKGLRNGIERINPNLREIGIHITLHGRKGSNASKGASLSIVYRRQQTSQTSQTYTVSAIPTENTVVTAYQSEPLDSYVTVRTNDVSTLYSKSNVTGPAGLNPQGIADVNDVSDVCDVARAVPS